MSFALEELEIHREVERLTFGQRAAVVLQSMDPRTVERILSHLSPTDVGQLYLETALLEGLSPAARTRILRHFCLRLRETLRVPPDPEASLSTSSSS